MGTPRAAAATAARKVDRLRPFAEHVAEATSACLLTMVQGNLLALTLGHWQTAAQTGIAAGTVTAATLAATRVERRGVASVLLGVVTTAIDCALHPGGFGPFFLEALVTGAGAAALSLAVHGGVTRMRRRARRVGR